MAGGAIRPEGVTGKAMTRNRARFRSSGGRGLDRRPGGHLPGGPGETLADLSVVVLPQPAGGGLGLLPSRLEGRADGVPAGDQLAQSCTGVSASTRRSSSSTSPAQRTLGEPSSAVKRGGPGKAAPVKRGGPGEPSRSAMALPTSVNL